MRLKFDEKKIGWAIMLVLLIASILAIFQELMP
jgi:cytochrome c1